MMTEAGMEVVQRKRTRRGTRWLPDERRKDVLTVLTWCGRALPGFFLACADAMGMPSGLHAAFAAAMALESRDVRPTLAGGALAILLRLLWGLPPRWEMLLTLSVLWLAPRLFMRKNNAWLMGLTAVAMIPSLVVAIVAGSALELILTMASIALAALSAPVFYRALTAIKARRTLECLEERIAVGYLAAMLLCGGGRMLVLGMNVGVLAASMATLLAGMLMSVGAGCIGGLIGGIVLAMQGLPLVLAVALSAGGFLSGMIQALGRRALTCLAYGAGCLTVITLSGASGAGCALAALAAPILTAVMPRPWLETVQQVFRRFLAQQPAPGDAYAASALAQWERTIASMAQAVPCPQDTMQERNARWWQAHLCLGCPEIETCDCMLTELAVDHAETVWTARQHDDATWQTALEHLRGLGCGRLYHLRTAMDVLRAEDERQQRQRIRAGHQRDMLVTHLTAMAGAARRFAALSTGDNWWDDMSARRLRHVLSEEAYPAALQYVRRLQGHIQIAFALQRSVGARKQAAELCELAGRVLEVPMTVASCEEGRVTLQEQPLLRVDAGVAARGFEGGVCNGDTAWVGILQDGRCLAALSDGMGHGEQAARESAQTAELLRLCMDAGYTRAQTLTAVNGMMLLAGQGERFATVDLLTVDLWTGQATLDKLGAADSWIVQSDELTCVSGDALPLGILETVVSRSSALHLRSGDTVVLLTDGVQEAFETRGGLEDALRTALLEQTAEEVARALLESAARCACGHTDDQTVMVLRIEQTDA